MASLGISLAPSMQHSSKKSGVLSLAPTYASVLKLPLVNTIQEDCSPPTLRLHKGLDWIKMRTVSFSPYISGLKTFTESTKLLFILIFVHISQHQMTGRSQMHRESQEPESWGSGSPERHVLLACFCKAGALAWRCQQPCLAGPPATPASPLSSVSKACASVLLCTEKGGEGGTNGRAGGSSCSTKQPLRSTHKCMWRRWAHAVILSVYFFF